MRRSRSMALRSAQIRKAASTCMLQTRCRLLSRLLQRATSRLKLKQRLASIASASTLRLRNHKTKAKSNGLPFLRMRIARPRHAGLELRSARRTWPAPLFESRGPRKFKRRATMSDRHDILEDRQFWLVLEYSVSGWFRTCGDNSLGGFWCDGLIPESARCTSDGIDVSGVAWIVDSRSQQHRCSFTAAIPQRALARHRNQMAILNLTLDIDRKELRFDVHQLRDAKRSMQS